MKEEIIKLYESGLSLRKIEKFCNVKRTRINTILNEAGVKMRSVGNSYKIRKYCLNHNYFNTIDTEEKAYWLGFIIADGHISNDGLVIGLSNKDKNHLEKLLITLESNSPLKYYEKTNSIRLNVYSKEMVLDFRNLGLLKNKSNTAIFPKIDKSLERHLIRGIVDGDGSIQIRNRNKRNLKNPEFAISICGTENIIKNCAEKICSTLDIPKRNLSMRKDNFGIVAWGGNKLTLKVLEYLYVDSSIHLERKYERYLELKNQQI